MSADRVPIAHGEKILCWGPPGLKPPLRPPREIKLSSLDLLMNRV